MNLKENTKAANTKSAYESDARIFNDYLETVGVAFGDATPGDVERWIEEMVEQGVKASTLSRRLSGVRHSYVSVGLASPTDHPDVKSAVAGARRILGTAQTKSKAADPEIMRRLIGTLNTETLQGKRDLALLLVGWYGGVRVSNLVSFDCSDMRDHPLGVVLRLRRSKTDQLGAGRDVFIPYRDVLCPVTALRDYLAAAGVSDGAIFRAVRGSRVVPGRLSRKSVSAVIETARAAAGVEGRITSHSLRVGFVTTASRTASIQSIMLQTGHRNQATVMGYIREEDPSDNNAVMTVSL